MTEHELKPALILVSTRCSKCSRFYGFEKHHAAGCPHCASFEAAELEIKIKRLERANAALRGCVGKKARR